MTTLPTLDILKQHREALLLAEVAAWLHDIGKFCNLHIEANAIGGIRQWANNHAYKAIVDNPAAQIQLSISAGSLKKPDILNNVLNAGYPKAADFLGRDFKDFLTNKSLTLLDESYTLGELIMLGTPGFAINKNRSSLLDGKQGWLAAVLGVCHNEAHVDKQEPAQGAGMPIWPNVFISSAFGCEKEKVIVDASPKGLDSRLQNLPVPPDREVLLKELAYGLGDTRRPVNEVLLSDWGWIVAALLKSALAGAILNNSKPDIRNWESWRDKIIDHDLHWRLLRVNFDVLGLYAKAVKIADLLAYQEKAEQACRQVKQLVEEEYPLGNEVYRDSTGLYFTFPDLDLPAELAQEIRRRVDEVDPELAPHIAVIKGKQAATAQEQLKSILGKAHGKALKALKQPFDAHNLSPHWQQKWEEARRESGKWEVCPVCRLRPKEEHTEVCPACEQRRESRLQTWRDNPEQTIWLGEIADHNDRVALLVGKFGLKGWLTGDLVQTMLVKAEENNPAGCIPKNPSPARLRRIWETCQRFWNNTIRQDILPTAFDPGGIRQHIIPDNTTWKAELYNGKVNDKPLDLFWQPEQKAFLTVSNLQAAGELKKGDTITLERPDTKQKDKVHIQDIREAPALFDHYQPFLPLLASPDQFLAFVPAAAAPKIVQTISAAYQEQFGKVRNRLPLSLGLVFFPRKIPLMAVMDAARAMLDCPSPVESWQIQTKTDCNPPDEDWPRSVQLTLTREGKSIPIKVPTVMGDDKTKDLWYPYFQLAGEPADYHTCRFIGPGGKHWVHVNNLKEGDNVHLTPSTFDFLWLNAASRRFEVDYDGDGRRPARPSRPFYLEDFKRLETLWGCYLWKQLSRTQLKQILQTIESTRERWFGEDKKRESTTDATFKQLVADTLVNARWDWGAIDEKYQCQLIAAGVRGELADLAELHLEILKEKNES